MERKDKLATWYMKKITFWVNKLDYGLQICDLLAI